MCLSKYNLKFRVITYVGISFFFFFKKLSLKGSNKNQPNNLFIFLYTYSGDWLRKLCNRRKSRVNLKNKSRIHKPQIYFQVLLIYDDSHLIKK